MKLKNIELTVLETLKENEQARNDNFILIVEVYKKFNLPIFESFNRLMKTHKQFNIPSFEGILRARRKVVKQYPELNATEKVKIFREKEEQEYINYSLEN